MTLVRVGYFEGFKGQDALLFDGDREGLGELAKVLDGLAVGERENAPLHSLSFVSIAGEIEIHAYRSAKDLGIRRKGGSFHWYRSSGSWTDVVEKVRGVGARGRCHHYLDGPDDDVMVMVSSGEYGEPWPFAL